MKRKHLSLAIGCVLMLPAAAWAQDAAPAAEAAEAISPAQAAQQAAETKTLGAIEVTARRRTESIQDVPVAVTAFGEEQLKDLQAGDIGGLQGAVPNLNIVQGRGSANSVNVFIRGIGQPDALQTFDPGVGMYVDDVYYSRINGALFSLFDVAQVEVLRGPQGTLYGKNSTGGAIKLTTKDPFDYSGGSVELLAGDYGRAQASFYVSTRVNDLVAASVAGTSSHNGGYVTDPVTGKHYNGDDTEAVRAKLAFRNGEDFSATLTLDHTKQDAALTLGRPTADLQASDLAGLPPPVLLPAPTGEYDFQTRTSFGPDHGQEMTHSGVAFNVDWAINDAWLFKSITASRKLTSKSYIDIDASEYELGDVYVAFDQRQFSQELQLQYDNGGNFSAIVGAYYLNEKVPSYQEAYADDFLQFLGLHIDFLRTIEDDLRTTSTAFFANADWEFAPTWTLSAGVRHSRDSKDYDRTTSAFFGAPFQAASADPQAVISGAHKTWTATTPSISLKKAFNDNMTGYVSANRGFKSGGFNGRANDQVEADNPEFAPEFVWTYEAGFKMQSADGRFSANIAAFHSEYEDFQARVSETLPANGIPQFKFPVINAAKMTVDGIEFEGLMRVGDNTTLAGQFGWMDARYDEFNDLRTSDPTRPDYDPTLHEHVPFSPEFTARVALQHAFDLGDNGTVTVGGDVSYRSRTWLSVDNRDNLSQGAYTLVGLYGVWDSPQYAWQVRGGIRNATDELYMTEGQEFSSVGNIQTAYFGMPRNAYVSVRYNF
ncbi:TonB-dependent receptor [Luteimonas sp. 8-5]|uniref:TonB-dependent receptor n=1 Tax=Luteimonas sp. 8-5 TaxID=3039387 RepID=UPI0024373504|nr:TonB-dependent receptor [Luteimonas sp. 8-5]MDG6349054.1 TonB-dependent receptor [Luteimonas sp. 8-5]